MVSVSHNIILMECLYWLCKRHKHWLLKLLFKEFMNKMCLIAVIYMTFCTHFFSFFKKFIAFLLNFILTYSTSPSRLLSEVFSVIFHNWLWITEVSLLVSVTAVVEKYLCASAHYIWLPECFDMGACLCKLISKGKIRGDGCVKLSHSNDCCVRRIGTWLAENCG